MRTLITAVKYSNKPSVMSAFLSRRRLVLRVLREIHAAGGGRDPVHYNPDATLISRSYSSTASSVGPNSEPCPATVAYLASCGLSPAAASAAATASKVRILSTTRADVVCALLRRYGFSDGDIARVARAAPTILSMDPDVTIRPKLDFFASLGVKPHKLASAPNVLLRSLDKHLVPCVQFLRGIVGNDNDVSVGISRVPRALLVGLEKNMRPAVEALRRHGLSEKDISKLLVMQMGVLMISPARISEIFEELEALGLQITDSHFLYCFRVMCAIKRETLQRKLAVYRSFGLSDDEVFKAFKTLPTILLLADETLKKKLRFFSDKLRLTSRDVIGNPVILGCSLEKNILPKCAVLNVLMREGKIRGDIKLISTLSRNSKNFSARYVSRYAKGVSDVVEAFEGKIKFEGFCDGGIKILKPKGHLSSGKSLV